jgi:hypothetical protein
VRVWLRVWVGVRVRVRVRHLPRSAALPGAARPAVRRWLVIPRVASSPREAVARYPP